MEKQAVVTKFTEKGTVKIIMELGESYSGMGEDNSKI